MKALPRLLLSSVIAGAVLVVGAAPVGCGDDGSGTTGRRIALEVKASASPESRRFTNAKGWDVTMTKALVSTGALYFYDGDTLFARERPSSSFVRSAFAHPGHYVPGNAKGEMRTPSSVDLLAGGALGAGEGVSGVVRSATFSFASPAAGPMAAELGANVIVLEGSAAKGAEARTFRVEIGPEDVKDAEGLPQIEGCPFEATDMQGDGVVTVTVDLPLWFDQVEFDDAPAGAPGATALLADGLAHNQLVRGTKAGPAYRFAFAPR